ncbi:MSMEG_0570 family nitrogen starvation response protein [Cupriavidus sp. UYPR2.512]|uniref:MSMEG_0570 family nitrogen starvation response protein n=1 Tax=Cupriavidus sp. UYPR2.512 TaxID=1080187 RepID=UPI000369452B|nr:MSMEG_0570 family nitrogen starvation response protein [Cupriavidus sp. UYPR2.512]UIF90999.1 MSMEG_0570 family nitrogen starvation response protein [Cupriavidus necator]
MPVTPFRIRWPDQSEALCYSPSSVVTEHLDAGRTYSLAEFVHLARLALGQASERVRMKYGYACSSAMDQLQVIEEDAARFHEWPGATVHVIGFGR